MLEVYFKKAKILQSEYPLSINELKKALVSLQTNKNPGHGEISCNANKNCFGSLYKPFLHFRIPLEERIFPDNLKTVSYSCF